MWGHPRRPHTGLSHGRARCLLMARTAFGTCRPSAVTINSFMVVSIGLGQNASAPAFVLACKGRNRSPTRSMDEK